MSLLFYHLASAQWGEEESNSSTSTVPVVSPTATPTPPNLIVNKTFTLNDTNNATQFCLRMTAAISVRIHYTNSTNVSCLACNQQLYSIDLVVVDRLTLPRIQWHSQTVSLSTPVTVTALPLQPKPGSISSCPTMMMI